MTWDPHDLRQMRKQAGLTLNTLGEKLGAHYTFLSRIERGKLGVSVEMADRWATACGFSIMWVPTSGGVLGAITPLAPVDQGIVMRFASVLPRLPPSHRASLLHHLDFFERLVTPEESMAADET